MKRLLLFLLTALSITAVSKNLMAADHVTTPLYADSTTGFVINTIDKMVDLDRFSDWQSRQNAEGLMRLAYAAVDALPYLKVYHYFESNQPNEWWRFEIDFDRSDTLSWEKDGAIYITAEVKGERKEFRSSEIFFADDGLRNKLPLPRDINSSTTDLDIGDNGIKVYARFPGTGGIDAGTASIQRQEGIAIFNPRASSQ